MHNSSCSECLGVLLSYTFELHASIYLEACTLAFPVQGTRILLGVSLARTLCHVKNWEILYGHWKYDFAAHPFAHHKKLHGRFLSNAVSLSVVHARHVVCPANS